MNIVFFVRHFYPNALSALPKTVYEISKYLIRNGHKVTIITNAEKKYSRTVVLDKNLTLKYSNNLYNEIDKDFDLVHFFGNLLGSLLFVNSIKEKCKIPIVISLYGYKRYFEDIHSIKLTDFLHDKRTLFFLNESIISVIPNSLIARKLNIAKKIIVQSNAQMDFYLNIIKSREKIIRIPHGVNFQKFSHYKLNKKMRTQLGFSEEDKIILYLGHGYIVRGIDDLIYSIPEIKEKIYNVKLLLVLNKMPDSPFDYIKKLIKNSSAYIKLIPRYVDNPQDYYSIADVIALPYRLSLELPEYPFVLLESMASKKPVVTTNIGAIPEIVKNGYNGLLIPPKNPQKLSESIVKILENNRFAIKLGKNAQNTVREFDWDIVGKRMLDLYKGVINEK